MRDRREVRRDCGVTTSGLHGPQRVCDVSLSHRRKARRRESLGRKRVLRLRDPKPEGRVDTRQASQAALPTYARSERRDQYRHVNCAVFDAYFIDCDVT